MTKVTILQLTLTNGSHPNRGKDYIALVHHVSFPPREALQKKKEELHAEKYKSRLDRRITFDFAGRKVVEEEGAPQYDFEQVSPLSEFSLYSSPKLCGRIGTFGPLIFTQ